MKNERDSKHKEEGSKLLKHGAEEEHWKFLGQIKIKIKKYFKEWTNEKKYGKQLDKEEKNGLGNKKPGMDKNLTKWKYLIINNSTIIWKVSNSLNYICTYVFWV